MISYAILSDGSCEDLTYLSESGLPKLSTKDSLLVNQFQMALSKIGVSFYHEFCKSESGKTLYGFYSPVKNAMTLCRGSNKDSKEYIDTLAHESWRTVQDCIDGLENKEITALSELSHQVFIAIVGSPSYLNDYLKVLRSYPVEQSRTDLEALYMARRPDVVLKGLKACAANNFK
ncbi:hypothetical protein [Chroococcus sp. FPU101]|uniref:hypothetical protein n=1 Tax=Chroococcus sp. FPU101 TaxID=1974212 RepID=UPI001A8DE59D|nr:hypothetical protein [Chroococcus sp. FPU101]GFE69713.1 hypothetical protein CFPU101_23230 [Chroococcus sp. FPU101]